MSAWTQFIRTGPALFILYLVFAPTGYAAPFEHSDQSTEIEYYPVADATGCYYNFEHYDEGDRIITNEPCLNCTCHNRMLMCYLRVCPFTKAIGQNCKVEKKPDQCCPVITCPEVPVQLVPHASTTPSTQVGHLNEYGCSIDNLFYADGAKVPSNPDNPCEVCYCIRNKTACIIQECTLTGDVVEGCRPVYVDGVCCPVRYDCEHPQLETTPRPLLTTTTTTLPPTSSPADCIYNNEVYADGALVKKDVPCEQCYCMRGDIICAVQECGPTPLDKVNCTALPTKEGQCCPDTYECENISEEDLTTLSYYEVPTTQPTVISLGQETTESKEQEEAATKTSVPEESPVETTEGHITESIAPIESQTKAEESPATESQTKVEEIPTTESETKAEESPATESTPVEAFTAKVTEAVEAVTSRVTELVEAFTSTIIGTEREATTQPEVSTEGVKYEPEVSTSPEQPGVTEKILEATSVPTEEEQPITIGATSQTDEHPETETYVTEGIQETRLPVPDDQKLVTVPESKLTATTESMEKQTEKVPTESSETATDEYIAHDDHEAPDHDEEHEYEPDVTEGSGEPSYTQATVPPAEETEDRHTRPIDQGKVTDQTQAVLEVTTPLPGLQDESEVTEGSGVPEEIATPTPSISESEKVPQTTQQPTSEDEGGVSESEPELTTVSAKISEETEEPGKPVSEEPIIPIHCEGDICRPVTERITPETVLPLGPEKSTESVETESTTLSQIGTTTSEEERPHADVTKQPEETIQEITTKSSTEEEVTTEEFEKEIPVTASTVGSQKEEEPSVSVTETTLVTEAQKEGEVPTEETPEKEVKKDEDNVITTERQQELEILTEIPTKETSKPQSMDHVYETVAPVTTAKPEPETTEQESPGETVTPIESETVTGLPKEGETGEVFTTLPEQPQEKVTGVPETQTTVTAPTQESQTPAACAEGSDCIPGQDEIPAVVEECTKESCAPKGEIPQTEGSTEPSVSPVACDSEKGCLPSEDKGVTEPTSVTGPVSDETENEATEVPIEAINKLPETPGCDEQEGCAPGVEEERVTELSQVPVETESKPTQKPCDDEQGCAAETEPTVTEPSKVEEKPACDSEQGCVPEEGTGITESSQVPVESEGKIPEAPACDVEKGCGPETETGVTQPSQVPVETEGKPACDVEQGCAPEKEVEVTVQPCDNELDCVPSIPGKEGEIPEKAPTESCESGSDCGVGKEQAPTDATEFIPVQEQTTASYIDKEQPEKIPEPVTLAPTSDVTELPEGSGEYEGEVTEAAEIPEGTKAPKLSSDEETDQKAEQTVTPERTTEAITVSGKQPDEETELPSEGTEIPSATIASRLPEEGPTEATEVPSVTKIPEYITTGKEVTSQSPEAPIENVPQSTLEPEIEESSRYPEGGSKVTTEPAGILSETTTLPENIEPVVTRGPETIPEEATKGPKEGVTETESPQVTDSTQTPEQAPEQATKKTSEDQYSETTIQAIPETTPTSAHIPEIVTTESSAKSTDESTGLPEESSEVTPSPVEVESASQTTESSEGPEVTQVPDQVVTVAETEIPEEPIETTRAPEKSIVDGITTPEPTEGTEAPVQPTESVKRPEEPITESTQPAEAPESPTESPTISTEIGGGKDHITEAIPKESVTTEPSEITETPEEVPPETSGVPEEGKPEVTSTKPEDVGETGAPEYGKTETPESTSPEQRVTEATTETGATEAEEEHGIPGEGSCLVDGQTYRNNSSVPPINRCQTSCKCVSSILQCESVSCSPPPSNLQDCMAIFNNLESCCPTYSCSVPGATSMESDSHVVETTTGGQEEEKPVTTQSLPEEQTTAPEISQTATTEKELVVTVKAETETPQHITEPAVSKGTEIPIVDQESTGTIYQELTTQKAVTPEKALEPEITTEGYTTESRKDVIVPEPESTPYIEVITTESTKPSEEQPPSFDGSENEIPEDCGIHGCLPEVPSGTEVPEQPVTVATSENVPESTEQPAKEGELPKGDVTNVTEEPVTKEYGTAAPEVPSEDEKPKHPELVPTELPERDETITVEPVTQAEGETEPVTEDIIVKEKPSEVESTPPTLVTTEKEKEVATEKVQPPYTEETPTSATEESSKSPEEMAAIPEIEEIATLPSILPETITEAVTESEEETSSPEQEKDISPTTESGYDLTTEQESAQDQGTEEEGTPAPATDRIQKPESETEKVPEPEITETENYPAVSGTERQPEIEKITESYPAKEEEPSQQPETDKATESYPAKEGELPPQTELPSEEVTEPQELPETTPTIIEQVTELDQSTVKPESAAHVTEPIETGVPESEITTTAAERSPDVTTKRPVVPEEVLPETEAPIVPQTEVKPEDEVVAGFTTEPYEKHETSENELEPGRPVEETTIAVDISKATQSPVESEKETEKTDAVPSITDAPEREATTPEQFEETTAGKVQVPTDKEAAINATEAVTEGEVKEGITSIPKAEQPEGTTELPAAAVTEGEVKEGITSIPEAEQPEGTTELPAAAVTEGEVKEGITSIPEAEQPEGTTELPATKPTEISRPQTESTDAYTSPQITTQPPVNASELYTSGPYEEPSTKKSVDGELSTSIPLTTTSSTEPTTASATIAPVPVPGHDIPGESEIPDYHPPEDYEYEDQGPLGPGTCRYGGKVYVSAQQIPREDPCDFCFCFRSDIICLQQSCPPPIPRCREEPIRGFCCPRYECPVGMAASINVTTSTTTTTTTLPPHFLSHAYKGRVKRTGCQIRGKAYRVGEDIESASGPCLHCTCGGDGEMKCDPKVCSPEPMLRQMIAAATSRRRR